MVESPVLSADEVTHRGHLAGEGSKPPKGALVKSQGAERLGKDCVMNIIRYGYKR